MNQRWEFRSWDHLLGQFNYFNLRNSLGHVPNDISDSQIQQFTGFLDIKGEPIYESDILEHVSHYSQADNKGKEVITFAFGCFYLGDIPLHNYLHNTGKFPPNPQLKNLKVVGNIFSNKITS